MMVFIVCLGFSFNECSIIVIMINNNNSISSSSIRLGDIITKNSANTIMSDSFLNFLNY